MSIQAGLGKFNQPGVGDSSKIKSSKDTFALQKGLDLSGKPNLIETEWLPCEITEMFNPYPGTPTEVIQYFRIKSVAAAVAGKSTTEFRKELAEQLAANHGNWLEMFDPKWPGGFVESRHVRPVLWMALYHEYKKITKEPVFAFRNVQQHADEVEKFYARFCNEELINHDSTMFITDREVMKIAREIIEYGTSLGFVKFLRKNPRGIHLS